jgi:undecaprenyl-diphosphatase
MPTSSSFPSGHSAAAFAFAIGVARVSPSAAVPLLALAALVSYSRVHTGVHYPGDVVAGSLLGTAVAEATTRALDARLR